MKCTCAGVTLASASRSGTEIHPALRRFDAFPESRAATPADRPKKSLSHKLAYLAAISDLFRRKESSLPFRDSEDFFNRQ